MRLTSDRLSFQDAWSSVLGVKEEDQAQRWGIVAGGLIHQTIVKDVNSPNIWEPECGVVFHHRAGSAKNSRHRQDICQIWFPVFQDLQRKVV